MGTQGGQVRRGCRQGKPEEIEPGIALSVPVSAGLSARHGDNASPSRVTPSQVGVLSRGERGILRSEKHSQAQVYAQWLENKRSREKLFMLPYMSLTQKRKPTVVDIQIPISVRRMSSKEYVHLFEPTTSALLLQRPGPNNIKSSKKNAPNRNDKST